jgi:ATP-dependent Clp protease ATP-binding subunit ClpC
MSPKVPNLTERTRRILELAQDAANERGDRSISPLHVALGLIREGEGVATTAMLLHGVVIDRLVRELIEAASAPDVNASREHQTSEVDALLNSAHREAVAIGHPYVGTEHLLLALLSERESLVAQAVSRQGMTYHDAKARILWILSGDPNNPEPFVPAAAV